MKKVTALTYQHQRHLSSMITTFFVLSLLISSVNALTISSLNDFINFTNTVNGGASTFTGETVYLNTDLDMKTYSSSFAPVGNSTTSTKVFRGTFDGQGHVISNLVVSSGEFRYLGIFGYSYGATIKNLIVDSSCSFENKYSNDENCATGSLIGRCDSTDDECIVENCVNMAQITYSGTNMECIYVGGIIGKFTPHSYNTSITSCVNYGNVSSVCSSLYLVRMGGIIGEVWTGSQITTSNTVNNCVNFGSLYQSGEMKADLYMGGICGVDRPNIVYEDCVAFGGMSYNTSLTSVKIGVGSISGNSTDGTLRNCFWDERLELNATGKYSNNVISEEGSASFNMSLFNNGPNILDTLKKASINFAVINFDSRGGSAVSPMLVLLTNANKAAIPLPTPERVESVFGGWYSDERLGTVFDTSTLKSGNITVYAKWIVNHYIITFTVDGKVYNESSQSYGSNIEYPINPTKEGHTFDGWDGPFTTVPAHNLVIESLWIVNSYTITFTVDGKKYNESLQPYGSNITLPENPTNESFTFDGWYTNSSFVNKVESNLTVTGNITLYGRFISKVVNIEFSTKDLNKDEVIKKIEKITGCTDCFTISEYKNDGDTTIIIIKFNDVSDAKNFVDIIQG